MFFSNVKVFFQLFKVYTNDFYQNGYFFSYLKKSVTLVTSKGISHSMILELFEIDIPLKNTFNILTGLILYIISYTQFDSFAKFYLN